MVCVSLGISERLRRRYLYLCTYLGRVGVSVCHLSGIWWCTSFRSHREVRVWYLFRLVTSIIRRSVIHIALSITGHRTVSGDDLAFVPMLWCLTADFLSARCFEQLEVLYEKPKTSSVVKVVGGWRSRWKSTSKICTRRAPKKAFIFCLEQDI